MSSWKECKLGDLITHKKGFAFKSKDFKPEGHRVVKVKDFTSNSIDISKCEFLDESIANQFYDYKLKINDIIIATVGSWPSNPASIVGKVIKVPKNAKDSLLNQNAVRLRSTEKINQLYLYYKLRTTEFSDYLIAGAQGSANQASITLNDIFNYSFELPPLEEQKAIAEILSSLDDKIDLLHRQNQTLESLAQTIFRQWFIEEAKEEWEEIKLGDFVDCITGYSYKSDHLNDSNNALVTLKNFARDGSFRLDGFKEFTGTKYKDSQIVKHGDLVVSHTDITQEADIIGNPVLVVDMGRYDNLIITMDLMKVESKIDWLSKEFLYYLFRTEDFKFHCLGNSNGTTVLHMSRKTIPEYKIKIPNIKRIEDFTNDVKEILQKQYVNILQIQTLENLRDTLLPKLLSGEVRVKI
ncbi:restriction endonuclease subunit S [Aliarcobacter cryaerophilus]|uniref:restriction endonuclease subunit S n=1 Tax=Aliarcobacter cryaerophilus TaxID=28198 RepID=UPI003DA5E4D3